ncbi:hypothetical protein A8L34_03325 [Bacillus sp. FJAT-27264]|uniref:hypothetical protein n=1 Tax=Paenibacillus sp. (strain DSM 101736 / FJAT-27264) TaxID=1850362 RepID=UPI000807F99B|nr:hypothetical protein [Bacillus sp. FJAT-27264]OBZ18614.1 hypothetical protein A8L34_03325 [Bacillus sp. FJAT-27264]
MPVFDHLRPFWDTVLRVAPLLYLDREEPFKPHRVGVTVFETTAPSVSFDRIVHVDTSKYSLVIEYAIYYDYDIQHIYDLEHVWVYLNHDGGIEYAEVSFHGHYLVGLMRDRSNLTDEGVIRIYVQPGKHAMAAHEELFRLLPNVERCCLEETGIEGVLEPDMFSGEFKPGVHIDPPAEAHLRTFSFQPSFEYVPYPLPEETFVSWPELREEIPVRMKALIDTIR